MLKIMHETIFPDSAHFEGLMLNTGLIRNIILKYKSMRNFNQLIRVYVLIQFLPVILSNAREIEKKKSNHLLGWIF